MLHLEARYLDMGDGRIHEASWKGEHKGRHRYRADLPPSSIARIKCIFWWKLTVQHWEERRQQQGSDVIRWDLDPWHVHDVMHVEGAGVSPPWWMQCSSTCLWPRPDPCSKQTVRLARVYRSHLLHLVAVELVHVATSPAQLPLVSPPGSMVLALGHNVQIICGHIAFARSLSDCCYYFRHVRWQWWRCCRPRQPLSTDPACRPRLRERELLERGGTGARPRHGAEPPPPPTLTPVPSLPCLASTPSCGFIASLCVCGWE